MMKQPPGYETLEEAAHKRCLKLRLFRCAVCYKTSLLLIPRDEELPTLIFCKGHSPEDGRMENPI